MKTLLLICIFGAGAFAMNAQTRSMVNMDSLPKSISEDISSQHTGWSPLEAYKVDDNGEMKYEVLVKKAESEMKLVYDENGNLLESVPHKETSGMGKDKAGCDDQGHKSGTASAKDGAWQQGTATARTYEGASQQGIGSTYPSAQDTTKTPTDTTKTDTQSGQSGASKSVDSESGASDYDKTSGNADQSNDDSKSN
jgi:hypothetical protein